MRKKKIIKNVCVIGMCVSAMLGMTACGKDSVEKEVHNAAKCVMERTVEPGINSIGGEWAIKGIAESGVENTEEFIETYKANAYETIEAKNGVLDEMYYTTYARVIIAMESIDVEPTNVDGYDFTMMLDDYEKITEQGINAASFALIGSQVADVQLENEQKYIDFILQELEAKNLYENYAMMDYCSMAVEGLSYYMEDENVAPAVEKCVEGISKAQKEDGSLGNCESTAEAIIALTSVGIDPSKDERFLKNDNSLLDGLLMYKLEDGYAHVLEGEVNTNKMSTEKALLALSAWNNFNKGETFY